MNKQRLEHSLRHQGYAGIQVTLTHGSKATGWWADVFYGNTDDQKHFYHLSARLGLLHGRLYEIGELANNKFYRLAPDALAIHYIRRTTRAA